MVGSVFPEELRFAQATLPAEPDTQTIGASGLLAK